MTGDSPARPAGDPLNENPMTRLLIAPDPAAPRLTRAVTGTDQTGARVQLVQHVSQLNVLLRATPKAVETEEPRRIGFGLLIA